MELCFHTTIYTIDFYELPQTSCLSPCIDTLFMSRNPSARNHVKNFIAAIAFLCATLSLGKASDDWDIEIVPSKTTGAAKIIDADFHSPLFFVILRNKTDHDLKVWRQWCSWGYFALSFTVTQEDGESFTLERRDGAWSWNLPDSTIVRPGKSFVLEVSITKDSPGVLVGFPEKFRDGEVTIQAHYFVNDSDEAKKHGVWTGLVSSSPEKVAIAKAVYD